MSTRHWYLALCALPPLAALAQPVSLRSTDSSELGIEIMGQRYESGTGSTVYTHEGNKVGLVGRFTQALPQQWFWGADGRQSHGSVNYSSANRGDKGGNAEVLTEARITGGKDFPLGSQLLAPYFGLGYRELYTDLRGLTSTGDAGYRRRSQYIYLPLGLTHRLQLHAAARLSTSLEYDLLLEGRQNFQLSDIDATSNDPVTSQRSGHGMRLHISYEMHDWSLGLFVHDWRIGASDPARQSLAGTPAALVEEPVNNTREVGVQLRLRFN